MLSQSPKLVSVSFMFLRNRQAKPRKPLNIDLNFLVNVSLSLNSLASKTLLRVSVSHTMSFSLTTRWISFKLFCYSIHHFEELLAKTELIGEQKTSRGTETFCC